MKQTYLLLNNGRQIPQFGLGVYQVPGDEETKKACLEAFRLGYRHIDTAHAYQNERGVGAAVRESGIPREEIWITSKLWPSEYGEGKTAAGHRQDARPPGHQFILTCSCCTSSSAITWVRGRTWKRRSRRAR